MQRVWLHIILIGALLAPGSAMAQQQFVLGLDSLADAGHLFDPNTGTVVQQNFIDIGSLDTTASTPKAALQVGNQIWVSDQIRDTIYRFDQKGQLVGQINSGLDNIKGMELVNDKVWVTNAGTNNGAPGNAIVMIDAQTGSITNSVATSGSLFDVLRIGNLVMGSNITTEDLEWYNLDGTFNSIFHSSDGVSDIDFPQQIFGEDDGGVLVSGFSPPSGVYSFESDGTSNGIVAANNLGPRGIYRLGNDNFLWTNGDGFFLGPTNNFNQLAGSGQFLTLITVPEPGCVPLGLIALAALVRRRRRG